MLIDNTVIQAFIAFFFYLVFTDIAFTIVNKMIRFSISLMRTPLLQSWTKLSFPKLKKRSSKT